MQSTWPSRILHSFYIHFLHTPNTHKWMNRGSLWENRAKEDEQDVDVFIFTYTHSAFCTISIAHLATIYKVRTQWRRRCQHEDALQKFLWKIGTREMKKVVNGSISFNAHIHVPTTEHTVSAGDAGYNFVAFAVSCFERAQCTHHFVLRCDTGNIVPQRAKWILNLNFFSFSLLLSVFFFPRINFAHIFPGIVHRFDSSSFWSTKIKSTKTKEMCAENILLSPSIVPSLSLSSFFHFLFYGFAFRFWLSVPKHNVFFCYRLKVNFLHIFFWWYVFFPYRRRLVLF